MTKKLLLVTLAISVAIAFSVNAAENPKSVKELTEKAESIIIGKVAKQTSEWDKSRTTIYTTITVDVDEYLKGDEKEKRQTIKIPGGKVGDIGLKVIGAPTFDTGEKALLFLGPQTNGSKERSLIGWNKTKSSSVGPDDAIPLLKGKVLNYLGKKQDKNVQKMQFPDPTRLAERAKKFRPQNNNYVETQSDGEWGWRCVWGDDFEGDFPGTDWLLARNANPAVNNGYTWGQTTYNPYAGEQAVWCAETNLIPGNPDLSAGSDNYPNNTQAWMVAGPFDLSDCYSAKLTFKIDQTVEPFRNVPPADTTVVGPVDWSAVGFSIDGVWFYLGPDFQFFYTSTGGYIHYEINIEEVIGPLWDKNQVWLCFIFFSDYQIGDRGTWIDNVKLKKYLPMGNHPAITSVQPMKQSAGTGKSVKITGINFGDFNSGYNADTKFEFFSGFYWYGDTIWVPATNFSHWNDTKVICEVPSGASSGLLRARRPGEGVAYHDFNVSFGYIGNRWNAGVGTAGGTTYPIVPFKVNPFSCVYYNPSQFLADVVHSANTWNTEAQALIQLEFAGVSNVSKAQLDGENTVLFDNIIDGYPSPSLTYLWFNGTGDIIEADIVLNKLYPWCSDPSSAPSPYSLVTANLATNEFGNFCGLTDLYGQADKEKTMAGFPGIDYLDEIFLDQHAIDLHPEDIEGLEWIYGKGCIVDFKAEPAFGVSPMTVNFTNQTISKFPIASYFWNFGNGKTSTEQNPTCVFEADGEASFDVELSVTDVYGHTTTGKIENAVQLNKRLAAGILAEPTIGFGPLTVQFVNRTVGMADSYLWDFGDGTTSTEKNPVHVYTKPGVYSVSLTSSGLGGRHTESVAGLIEVYDDMEHLGLTYLKLVDATGETWSDEGWDNTIDQNTFHHWATTNVRGDRPSAVFTFDDGFARNINKIRMLNDTGVEGKASDYVTRFTVAVSMDGENFTDIGTFTKNTGGWEEFSFDPVEALFVKLTCEAGNSQWQQIGEFEVYEKIVVPDIAGSIITATPSHVANGYDASTVQVYLADANGNPVTGLPPSYFRINATGSQNFYYLVTETEQPGVYAGAFSSLTPEEKEVAVRVGGVRLASSSLTTAMPVLVKFAEPELTKETLVVDNGSQTWRGEGWDMAVDGDVNTQVAAIQKYTGCFGIYKFADDGERAIIKIRLFRGTGHGYPQQLVKEYRVSTSLDGTNFTKLFEKSTSATDWEEKLTIPVKAKYVKLELLDSDDNYRALSEFEVYTTPLIGSGPNALAGSAFNNTKKAIPSKYALNQNYPNPFNPETMITFDLPEQAKVSLQVYNLMGQTIRSLVNENKPAGSYRIQWDGKDDNGKAVASGVYFYQIKAIGNSKTFSQKMKMMLVR